MSVVSREISISSKSDAGRGSLGKIGMLFFYIMLPVLIGLIHISIINRTRKSTHEIKVIKREISDIREQIEALKYKKSRLLRPDNIRNIAKSNGYVSAEGKVLKYYVEAEGGNVGE